MSTTAEQIEAVVAKLGLSMSAEFVPFSRSLNAKEKSPSLNWKVTIQLVRFMGSPDRPQIQNILTTEYMAGCGHCPSHNYKDTYARKQMVAAECEEGRKATSMSGGTHVFTRGGKPILPKLADVLYSLVMDSDVLNCSTFEEWASEAGYDTDSRKAEAIYRACLEIGLKLRNAIGEAGLKELREACQDY